MAEPDVIDVEAMEVDEHGTEIELRSSGEVTLFRTEDPQEIVTKATEMATVLAKVLKDQKLTTNISGREHVRVEGWTFCGTMLGVFPVCTWTRKIEDGWEARVEARTRDGSVVGAAEAQCLSTEARWKGRDDYALRSMAQTRAVSKAMRLPLGFIVSLAGFDTTPAEEMERSGPPASGSPEPKPEPQKVFDPANELLPGAIKGATAWAQIAQALQAMEPSVDWSDVTAQAVQAIWPAKGNHRDLDPEQTVEFLTRLSNAIARIQQDSGQTEWPNVSDEKIKAGFAWAFVGVQVELTPKVTDAALSADEAAAMAGSDDVEF